MYRLLLSFAVLIAISCFSGCAAVVTSSSRSNPGQNQNPPPNPISVSITGKFTSQFVGGPAVPLAATVTNDSSNRGVTWALTVGGVSCSPACGSLTPGASPSFSATFTPPAALPAAPNNSPTITATSVANTAKKDSFTFSLAFTTGSLAGNYVLLLRGFGPNGVPAAIAGTLNMNQSGGVTGGELDANIGGQISTTTTPLVGAYTADTSFNGITRGTITITNFSLPGTSSNLALKCAISADGKRGKVIEFDSSEWKTSGTLLQQDPTALNGSIPTGSFAFGLDSAPSAGARVVEVGQFALAAAGITAGLVDLSQAQNTNPIYSAAPVAPGPATTPDAFGRGTLTLTVAGNATKYAYYEVNASQLYLIEIDNGQTFGTVQAGTARLQNALTANSANATSVFQMTGIDTAFGTQNLGPAVTIGVMSIAAANTLNLTFDANDAGTVITARSAAGQLVSFDPSTGRGVLSFTQGASTGFLNSAVFYLYDAGSGFLLDADPTTPAGTPPNLQVTNKAYSGTLSLQNGAPFGNQSLSGNIISVSGSSSIPIIPEILTALNLNDSNGSLSAIADVSSLDSQIGDSPSRTFTEDYQLLNLSLGYGTAAFPPGYFGNFDLNQSAPTTFYMIGPNQFVLIGTLSGSYSGVAFFDPD